MPLSNSSKIDSKLKMSVGLSPSERNTSDELLAGYDESDNLWRLIIKYNGDIHNIAYKYGAVLEILTENCAIVTIAEPHILNFSYEKEVSYIEKPKRLFYDLNISKSESCISQVNNYPQYGLTGKGIIIGIIDTGIDYYHPDFIDQNNESRILFIWDQSLEGTPPEGFSHGAQFTQEQITEAISEGSRNDAFKKVPHQDIRGHGTHVAGIAAGNGRASNGQYRGVAPDAQLIVVKLGQPDYEGYPINSIDIMFGMKYLITKAEELGVPISINISVGSPFGAHDGSSLFEIFMQEMAMRWKTSICVGVGNEGAKGLHIHGNVSADDYIQFVVNGKTREISLDIWKSQTDFYQIELRSPNGMSTGEIPYQDRLLKYRLGNEKIIVQYQKSTPFNTKENILIEIINELDIQNEGIWTLVFHGFSVITGDFDIWLSSNEANVSFLNPTTDKTLTLPSTVQNVICVAGYDPLTGRIANFSGKGTAFWGMHMKPDISAPCTNIMSTYPPSSYTAMSGTSMAAPFATGSAALLMQWGIILANDPYLYGLKLRSYLCAGAKRTTGIQYPNITWGYGKMCLLNSLEILMGNTTFVSSTAAADIAMAQVDCPSDSEDIKANIISEEYINILVAYNNALLNLLNRNDKIILGNVFNQDFAIIYVHYSAIDEAVNGLDILSNLSLPNLFALMDHDSLSEANILPIHNNPNISLRGNGILIGILDTGIDYTHKAFLYEDNTTKILSIWDQTIHTGTPPINFNYGSEYTKEQIDEALQLDQPLDLVPTTDENGHGTFLAGIACGRDDNQYTGVAPDAKIIAVKLAPAKKYARYNNMLFDETKAAYQDTDLLTAMYYLIDTANTLNMPLVICLGLGTTQGGHDGDSYFPFPTMRQPVAVVAAAGNEGNARNHCYGFIPSTNQTYDLEVNVGDGEQGVSIYIWGYTPDKISVGIHSPSGEIVEKVAVRNKDSEIFRLVFYDTTIYVTYYIAIGSHGDQLTVVRLQNPEPGIWKIILFGDHIINGGFHAWLLPQIWLSRNTFFLQSTPNYTITEIANSNQSICVGAYNHIDQNLYIESSLGPTRHEQLRPDLLAPGVRIGGPLPGNSYGVMTGTSAAAAHVAGAAALIMEWGIVKGNFKGLNTQIIRSLLIAGCKRRTGITYPNNQYGYGQLDLLNTFREISTIPYKQSYQFYIDEFFNGFGDQ